MKRRTQLTLGLGLLALAPVALAQGGDIALLNVVTHGNTQEYSVKIQVLRTAVEEKGYDLYI